MTPAYDVVITTFLAILTMIVPLGRDCGSPRSPLGPGRAGARCWGPPRWLAFGLALTATAGSL